jgi:hypothetical protein
MWESRVVPICQMKFVIPLKFCNVVLWECEIRTLAKENLYEMPWVCWKPKPMILNLREHIMTKLEIQWTCKHELGLEWCLTIGGACTNPNIVRTFHYMLGRALVLMVNCVRVGDDNVDQMGEWWVE